jgi:hypothetical protein
VNDVHSKSLLIQMYALVSPKGHLGVCECSRSLAGTVVSLSFQQYREDTIFVHCRFCMWCVVSLDFVMDVLYGFFVDYVNKNIIKVVCIYSM